MFILPFYINGILDEEGNLKGFETLPDKRELAWQPGALQYHCTPEQWKDTWKIGEWNHLRIRCVGKYPVITTWINHTKIARVDGSTSPHPDRKSTRMNPRTTCESRLPPSLRKKKTKMIHDY